MALFYFSVILLAFVSPAYSSYFSTIWFKAIKQTMFEQEIEDVNAVHRSDDHLVRRLIVMPLTEAFNGNPASVMQNKVQYGDKCSLPASLGRLIFEKPYEVPWIFEVTPVNTKTSFGDFTPSITSAEGDETAEVIRAHTPKLSKAYISPLDFRSPENYIFMPKWLMNSLRLQTNDIVDISFVRIKLAGLVVLQPMSLAWDSLEKRGDPRVLLEHEVNKYSTLTAGSTIFIEIGGTEHPIYVKETRGENGVSMKGVKVQDADIRTDINRDILDSIIKKAKKKKEEAEGSE